MSPFNYKSNTIRKTHQNKAREMHAACILMTTFFVSGCSTIAPGHADIYSSAYESSKQSSGWANFSENSKNSVIQITPEVISAIESFKKNSTLLDLKKYYGNPQPYTIGPGDVIGVIIYDHPELMPSSGAVISQQADATGVSPAPGLIVNAEGEITYPYIGRIKISGLTEAQATELISKNLSSYIKSPQITLRIQSYRSRRVYVEGEIRTPGMQIFTDRPMSVLEAINRAGGITSNGDRSNIVLTREGRSSLLDLAQAQEQLIDLNRVLLRDGDTIQVRNRDERKVYVMGESFRPSALVMRDGRLSLGQALGESGGVNMATSNPGQIYVIRKQNDGLPSVFHLDAKNPSMLAIADNFNLEPRDVVYVDPVALVRWNRIISLILPSASVLNTGSEINAR